MDMPIVIVLKDIKCNHYMEIIPAMALIPKYHDC